MSPSMKTAAPFLSRFARSCLLLLLLSVPAAAQSLNIDAIKAVPRYPSPTVVEFQTQSTPYTDSTVADKALTYTIRLPAGWKRGDSDKLADKAMPGGIVDDGQRNVLNRLAIFYGNDGFGQPSHIDISALRLSYDISLRNWFINYVVGNGYTLQGIDLADPRRIEALYVVLEGDQSYVVRTVAVMNGGYIGVASYYMPEENFNQRRGVQERAIDTFQFTNSSTASPENPLTFGFLDVLRFDYPSSWHIDAQSIDSPTDMHAVLVGETNKASGTAQISVHIVGAQGANAVLADKLQEQKMNLAKIGMTVGNLLEVRQDFTTMPQVYFKRVEVYEAHGSSNQYVPQEYWLAVLAESRYYYIITMLTPSRSANFLVWARNTEAFKTVVGSFRP